MKNGPLTSNKEAVGLGAKIKAAGREGQLSELQKGVMKKGMSKKYLTSCLRPWKLPSNDS